MDRYTNYFRQPALDYEALADEIFRRLPFDIEDAQTYDRFVSGLKELHAMIMIEGSRALMSNRTDVNRLIRRLESQKRPAEEILKDPFANEIIYNAWLDIHAVYPHLEDPIVGIEAAYKTLHNSPHKLQALLQHLRNRIAEFDALDTLEQSKWPYQGKTEKEDVTRRMLYPYLQKGKPISVETRAVIAIAALYTLATGSPFTLTYRPSDNQFKSRYSGRGIAFACSVIRSLSLSAYFGFSRTRGLNRYRPRRARKTEPARYGTRLEKPYVLTNNVSTPEALVANKIGDTWRNYQRKMKRESSSN